MNFDYLPLKPEQDQPDYIQAPHLLRLERAGIVRLDRVSNQLQLSSTVFDYLDSFKKRMYDALDNAESFYIRKETDTELSAFLASLRTVKALPLSLLMPVQITDCVYASHLVSRTDCLLEAIVASESPFSSEWFEATAQKLRVPGCFVETYSGFRMIEGQAPKYSAPQYDNSQFARPEEQQEVSTPDMHTIEELADFLKLDKREIIKAVLYECEERLVFVYIRGDLDVDEQKLFFELGNSAVPASTQLIERHGFVPGFAGWHGVKEEKNVTFIIDESLRGHRNAVTGANRTDLHITGYDICSHIKNPQFIDVAVISDPFKGICYLEFVRNNFEFEVMSQGKVKCYSGVLKAHILEILAADASYRRNEDYFAVMVKNVDTSWMQGVIDSRPKATFAQKRESARLGLFRSFIVVGKEFLATGEVEAYDEDCDTPRRFKPEITAEHLEK